MMEKAYGYSGAGIFGYSHLYGGYPGGQEAEFGNITGGETVAIWGCGPVSQFSIKSCYLRPLLRQVEEGKTDPSYVVTHRMSLEEAPRGYEMFKHKEDGCIKVVLKP